MHGFSRRYRWFMRKPPTIFSTVLYKQSVNTNERQVFCFGNQLCYRLFLIVMCQQCECVYFLYLFFLHVDVWPAGIKGDFQSFRLSGGPLWQFTSALDQQSCWNPNTVVLFYRVQPDAAAVLRRLGKRNLHFTPFTER